MCVEWNGREVKKIIGGDSITFFPPVFWFSLYLSVPYDTAGVISNFNHPEPQYLVAPAETFFHDQLGDGKGGALPKPRMMTSHTDGWRLRRPSYGTGVRASPEAELSVREDGVSPLCPYQFPTMRIVFQMVGIAPAPDLSYNGGVQ